MSDDYHADYNHGFTNNVAGDRFSPGYVAGQNARARANDDADRRAEALKGMGIAYRNNPVKFVVSGVAQTVGASAVTGLIAAGLARLNDQPPLEWAIPTAKWTAVVFLAVLGAFMLGVLLRYVVTLWLWMLGFGGIGGGAAYVMATMAHQSRELAQQQAIHIGVRGVLLGFIVGMVYKLTRLTYRALTARRSPKTLQ